jgi:hypothetical protein
MDPTGHEVEPYSEQWWINRYYDLKLWLYEDPGHDITTSDQLIERRKDQLRDHGVSFGAGKELLTLDAVNNIWFAVTAYAGAIQSAVKDYFYIARENAFLTFMGRIQIKVAPQNSVV